ncbi:MAG: uridine diphosphate-N-acetylglucosamine-binding protein YvcK [Armatimonadetes bacterium]|nr:uridine diphosphate-N-acetylglucosamine-binding protein YvcK [Armatimonadota bacterium]
MIINRRMLKRWLAPTAEILWAVVALLFGLAIVLAGLSLSFRALVNPLMGGLERGWNSLLRSTIGVESLDVSNHLLGGAFLLLGLALLWVGGKGIMNSFVRTLNPNIGPNMATAYVRKQQLARGPKIVCLGGGTGLSTLLRGLKSHSSNITAIVTVTDDGGSSGRLSEELGIIPPGDMRNCLVALADAEKLMTDLFQYRFKGKSGSLSGHSLGNLLIAGLIEQSSGDFEKALNMASEVLAIRGRVMPSSLERIRLRALLEDGSEVCGETKIVESGGRIRRLFIDPQDVQAYPEAIEAIEEAEMIVIGPGSVYTSVIPNLLVKGIPEAIRNSKAVKAYVCNVMTQPGESDAFSAAEHLLAIEANVEHRLFEYILVNTQVPSSAAVGKYRDRDQYPVEPDIDRIRSMGFRVKPGDFMSESDFVRHDPLRVTDALMEIFHR